MFIEGGKIEDLEDNTPGDNFEYSSNSDMHSFEFEYIKQYSEPKKQDKNLEKENENRLVTKNPPTQTPNSGKVANVTAIRLSYEKHKSYMKKQCEHCRKFLAMGSFPEHMLKVHSIEGKFYKQCNWCGKKLSANAYRDHAISRHFYGRFVCEICAFIGSFANEVIEHCKVEHGEHNSAKCPSCKEVHTLHDLEHHYKSCVSKKYQADSSDRICATCGKNLKSQTALLVHMKTHLRKEHAKSQNIQNDDLYNYCDKCDKKFVSLDSLNHHVQSAHENIEYKCSLCPMTFKTHCMSVKHKRIVHSSDEKYQCKFCGKRFGNVDHRKLHERVHKEPEFQCRLCPKRLKSPLALKAHESQHTGERPFKCLICEAGFVSSASLRQHTRGTHKIVGPRGGRAGWKTKTRENGTE